MEIMRTLAAFFVCSLAAFAQYKSEPAGAPPAEVAPAIAQVMQKTGTKITSNGSDRRGQTIKAGVYTLRYGIMPVNGDHQGAAPQRDFVLMTPAADDKDLNATPNFEALVAMSRKASGT